MKISVILIFLLLLVEEVCALEFDVFGTVTQRLLYSDGYTFHGSDSSWSADSREANIATFMGLTDNLSLSAQVYAVGSGDIESFANPKLRYAQLLYQIQDGDWSYSMAGGRVSAEYGLYSGSQFVPEMRPSVFLPYTIYRELLTPFFSSFDGVSLSASKLHGNYEIKQRVYLGYPITNQNTETYFYGTDIPTFKVEPHFSQLATTTLSSVDNRFIASYTFGSANFNGQMFVNLFSLHYSLNEQHSFSAEFFINNFKSERIYRPGLFLIPSLDIKDRAGYIQYQYTYTNKTTLLLRYEKEEIHQEPFQMNRIYSDIVTANISHRLTNRFEIQAQYSIGKGNSVINKIENNLMFAEPNDKWSIFAVSLNYTF